MSDRMGIIARCPGCGRTVRLRAGALDRRVRCDGCGRLFKMPTDAEIGKAIEVIRTAEGRIYVDEEGNVYG